jgi:hypothetical protein
MNAPLASPVTIARAEDFSLEERVNVAYRRLILILGAGNVTDMNTPGLDVEELLQAIKEAAGDAADAIDPLRHAPAAIANWTPVEAKP